MYPITTCYKCGQDKGDDFICCNCCGEGLCEKCRKEFHKLSSDYLSQLEKECPNYFELCAKCINVFINNMFQPCWNVY